MEPNSKEDKVPPTEGTTGPPPVGYGPPGTGYGPPQGGYGGGPPQGGYGGGPPQGGYGGGPPQGGYGGSPPQGGHGGGPPQGGYGGGPAQGGYGGGPPQGGYGPPPGSNAPPPGGFPPPQGGYGPPQGNYGPPPAGYPAPQGGAYPPGPPITNQPMGHPGTANGDWMHRPQAIPNCPPGLEYLTTINNLLVHQTVEMLEVFSGYETENKYYVANSLGQKVYFAREESEDCARTVCGAKRPFHMKIMDNYGNQVINLVRPLACQACCFPCCMQTMEVTAPPGNIIGLIEQEWNLLYPTFAIKTPDGETVLRIKGPWCTMDCYSDVEFKVLSADESGEVGKISKKWSGYAREAFTTADTFGISFPMDLDVRMKAVMLGACFLIDMMYFEQKPASNKNQNNQNRQNTQPV